MKREFLTKNNLLIKVIIFLGLVQSILLAALVAIFLAFLIGSQSMKENTIQMKFMTEEMLNITREMRQETRDLGDFIRLAIPGNEMNRVLRFINSFISDEENIQKF